MALASRTSRPSRRRDVPRERESGVRLINAAENAHEPIDELRVVASSLLAAALGFEVCARRAHTNDVVARMTALAERVRAVADLAAARVPNGVRKPSTSERMRWEWLASTAALLDGGAEGRIADEANRHLAIAVAAAAKIDDEALATGIEELAATSRAVTHASKAALPSNDRVASS